MFQAAVYMVRPLEKKLLPIASKKKEAFASQNHQPLVFLLLNNIFHF